MNITDIDDKIIKRARQNYLFEQYIKQNNSLETVLADVKNVRVMIENAVSSTRDDDKRTMLSNSLNKLIAVEGSIAENTIHVRIFAG
jgi:cysteinyl-tRNA synthetase